MTVRRTIVMSLYGINALVSLGLGGTYLLRDTFMPYHEAALGRSWAQLDPSTRVLIEALMDVAGAGWIVLGLATLALLWWPVRNEEQWSRFLVPVLLLTFYGPTLMATLSVLSETAAQPPWYGNATACVTTALGFLLDRPWS